MAGLRGRCRAWSGPGTGGTGLPVGYEHFVSQPQVGLRSLLDFLEEPARYDERAIAGVTATSIGKGRAGFTDAERARLVAVAGQTLERLGYAD